jgi:hypothetical protein
LSATASGKDLDDVRKRLLAATDRIKEAAAGAPTTKPNSRSGVYINGADSFTLTVYINVQ